MMRKFETDIRTVKKEEVMFWMAKSQQREQSRIPMITEFPTRPNVSPLLNY